MAKGKGSKESHYHDKGGHDASRGKYDPPHSIVKQAVTWSDSGTKKIAKENSAYNSGWKNTKDQKDKKK